MATSAARKPAKPTKEEKSAARLEKRAGRRQTLSNIKQAFSLTRQHDPKFVPLLIIAMVVAAALAFVVVFFVTGSPVLPIPFAILLALLAGMILFSRRAQTSMYSQAEGQPGAAGWLLQQNLRGDWRISQAVAGTTHLDAVHRVIGKPGIVLIGEGAPHRVKGLLAQEKKKVARVAGDTPIYDLIVGTGDGEVRLGQLNKYLLKLPNNLSKDEIGKVEKRLSALTSSRAPLPQGPMPQGAKMRNMQRTVRRRT